MATIHDRTALGGAPTSSDQLYVNDASDTTDHASGTDKRMTVANLTTYTDTLYQGILTEGAFVDGDKTKLDGIETAADVTDVTNVTAAGALMDSEVTNLAQVKAFDATDYATAAQGVTADSALQPADAVTQLDGTANRVLYVDSLGDVTELALGANGTYLKSNGATSAPSFATPGGSGDVSKVGTPVDNQVGVWTGDGTIEGTSGLTYDGVALGITGNITVSGTVDGRDLATDGTKLDGIEASADVTDVTNVTAAGALMDSEVTNLAQVKAFDTTDYATAAQGTTADSAMQDLVDDTTPQLGGELDAQANSIGFTMQTATGDGATTVDWGNGNHIDFTFGAFNETFTFTAPAKTGVYTMSLKQDSVGSRTATWPATVKWPAGTAPTLTTTATTGYDLVAFRYDGTNYYATATLNYS